MSTPTCRVMDGICDGSSCAGNAGLTDAVRLHRCVTLSEVQWERIRARLLTGAVNVAWRRKGRLSVSFRSAPLCRCTITRNR